MTRGTSDQSQALSNSTVNINDGGGKMNQSYLSSSNDPDLVNTVNHSFSGK